MPISKDCDRDTADNLRRGAEAASARGLRQLAEVLRQRAGEIEAAQISGSKAA